MRRSKKEKRHNILRAINNAKAFYKVGGIVERVDYDTIKIARVVINCIFSSHKVHEDRF